MAALTTEEFLTGLAPLLRAVNSQTDAEFSEDGTPLWKQYLLGDGRIGSILAEITATVTFENRMSELVAEWYSGTADGGPNGDGLYPLRRSDGTIWMVPSPALLAEVMERGDPGLNARNVLSAFYQYGIGSSEILTIWYPPDDITFDVSRCKVFAETPPTGNFILSLLKNGAAWGTATIAAGQNSGTVVLSNTSLLRDQKLTVRGPSTQDGGIANVSLILSGTQ